MATGESINGEAGLIPVDVNPSDFLNPSNFLNDTLDNFGASTSSATSSSSVNFGGFGEINLASGKSTAGNIGVVKGVAFAILAIAGYAVFAYFSREKGGK